MTPLRQRMIDDMRLRNYSAKTIKQYVAGVRYLAEYFGRSPDQLNIEHVRQYQIYLVKEKTAVLYATRGQNKARTEPILPGIRVEDVAASFQEAVCEVLVERSVRAALEEGVANLAVCGGVAMNGRLRQLAAERGGAEGLEVVCAHPAYCTDNGAMIAGVAAARAAAGQAPDPADLGCEARSRSEVA